MVVRFQVKELRPEEPGLAGDQDSDGNEEMQLQDESGIIQAEAFASEGTALDALGFDEQGGITGLESDGAVPRGNCRGDLYPAEGDLEAGFVAVEERAGDAGIVLVFGCIEDEDGLPDFEGGAPGVLDGLEEVLSAGHKTKWELSAAF